MKKLLWLLFALSAELVLAEGRLSTVSVSENGTVMLTTGNPNEFKSSWSGQPGQYKMIIELPGVAVDKSAKVLGNLAANRGIKNVRFSQFKTEPPVARVIIETPERLSYSWSTKPDGVELHFMLPSPVTTTATAPSSTGFAVPSSVFSQNGAPPSSLITKQQAPSPAGTTPKTAKPVATSRETEAGAKAEPKSPPTISPNTGAKTPVTVAGTKPAPAVLTQSPKSTGSGVSPATGSPTLKTTDSAVKQGNSTVGPSPAGTIAKQGAVNETVKPVGSAPVSGVAGPPAPPTATAADNRAVTVIAPAPVPQKDSAPIPAVSSQQGKTGTTTPAKSTPPAGTAAVPTSGGTGVVVKPASPASGQSAQNEKNKTVTVAPSVRPSTPAASISISTKPGTTGTTTPSAPTGKPSTSTPATTTVAKPADTSKTGGTTVVKPAGPAPAPAVGAVTKPTVPGSAADTAGQEKFKEQLKKALGKLETPPQPTGAKPGETDSKTAAAPPGKQDQTSFQEQLKQALDPAKSLADTGEVADVDDIDTDLPATDEEEEEPYDTTFAIPGGTFMQVSPSRKVIRYHSEGRRDPFSPLTGRDRYASGKKRRAVPAAEQLRLVGIMRSLSGNKALLEDGEGNGYILAPGDRVRNGYLVSVSESKVLFQVTEYGWTKTVAMELGTFE